MRDTPPTNPPTPRRYWAVTDAEGGIRFDHFSSEPMVFADIEVAKFFAGFRPVLECVVIPHADHARLLAIEAAYETLKAAVENALDNSWMGDYPTCENCQDCTVLDPKDAAELWEALT